MIHTTPAERQTRGVRDTLGKRPSARSRETAPDLLFFWLIINSYTEHLRCFIMTKWPDNNHALNFTNKGAL